jgi:hypothetical protein
MNGKLLFSASFTFALCFLLALASGCKKKEAPFLSEKEMVEVLRELHLADVLAEANGKSLGWRHAVRSEYYDEVLENFGISRPEFYRSYTHYLDNPETMDSIYVRMIRDIEDRMEVVRNREYDQTKDKDKWNKLKENIGKPKNNTEEQPQVPDSES